MTTHLCSRRRVAVVRAAISAAASLLVLVVCQHAMATPVFAQAYGTACHTPMPMHDAFGRYTLYDYDAAVLPEVHGAGKGRLPNVDVGVHNHALDYVGGRWETKFHFVRGKTLAQAAYLRNATGVSPFGFTGPALIRDVHLDNYNAVTSFIKKDARAGSPSFRCEFATATHSNPGYLWPRVASNPIQPAGSRVSSWMIGSAPQMVEHEHDHGTINFTYYQTNQALGEIGVKRLIPPTGTQTDGGPGFSYAIDPYTRFYTTVYLQNQRPALSILMQLK